MSRIKILSESLANQIAAGEVVERPASVVKELLENALDAGAAQVAIQVEGAGTRLIRVIDDGQGMDQDDLLLCLERHATSKLTCAEQLAEISTLGFRGEAIPSIASVARLTITSRIAEAALGNQVDIRFGVINKVHEMGCAKGVIMEVRDLFGNVPARRKFLKSAQTEIAHIEEVVRAYGLVNHEVGLHYQVNGKSVFELLPAAESESRVRQLLGGELELIPLDNCAADVEGRPFQVRGFLVPPDQAAGKAARLWLFVNGRSVKDRMIQHAVLEGLRNFLLKGGKAAGVLYLFLPADALDVNVHPTKQEVRFREPGFIHQLVVAAVRQGMASFQDQLKFAIFGPPAQAASPALKAAEEAAPARRDYFSEPPDIFQADRWRTSEPPPVNGPGGGGREAPFLPPAHHLPGQEKSVPRLAEKMEEVAASPAADRPAPPTSPSTPGGSAALTYIGQLLDTYLLCAVGDGLVVIDQHAAQERLIFEELKSQYSRQDLPSQALLFPPILDFSREQRQVLAQFGKEIAQLGLELQEFGGDSFVVKAVPATLAHLAPAEVVQSILERFAAEPLADSGASRLEHVLAGMACKAAIKGGRRLLADEAAHLLAQMQGAGIFSHCPHGRPVTRHFSRQDLQRWFHRS